MLQVFIQVLVAFIQRGTIHQFIDCLSWLELGLGYGDDYLVLNSVSLLERSFPILDRYERVNCYLDRDEATKGSR